MKLYEILIDEESFYEFVNWLPDLQDNECFYLSLFARKKYSPDLISSSDKQLKRFTATKKTLYQKIKQLEIPVGRYTLKKFEIPQESLVLYITPNPRCMKKATIRLGKKCWDLLGAQNFNIHAEALTCIQQSISRSVFVDFDIDKKEVRFDKLYDYMSSEAFSILETKGGFHILVETKKVGFVRYKTHFYKGITNNFQVDQTGDMMIPVPGTYQGGYVPQFVKITKRSNHETINW